MSEIRIGLIDSNETVRSGRAMVIGSQPDMRVIFEESDPIRAIELAPDYLVDVVIAGPNSYKLRGGRLLESLCNAMFHAGNSAAIVSYGPFLNEKLTYEAILSGAQDYFGLDQSAAEQLKIIRNVTKRDFLLNPARLQELGDAFGFPMSSLRLEEKLSELSENQTRMVELFLTGESDLTIAKKMDSTRTGVAQLIDNLVVAGGFTSRNQLALCLLGGAN
ncbi:MAG: hypothetical protein ACKOOE_01835 [Micrococcales bacterium]